MCKKEYYFFPLEGPAEEAIRHFLFEHADRVRLTRAYFWVRLWTKKGKDDDPRFLEIMEMIGKDLLHKEVNNRKYADWPQGKRAKFTHCHFRLSDALKERLTQETLSLPVSPYQGSFYGFEDPTFFRGQDMIASVVSHDRYIVLFLTDAEAATLEEGGVALDATNDW